MAVLEGAILPKGSWILVTGANGYVASHVIDQLLRLGYNARGTVRDAQKSSWLTSYFSKKYPDAKFELVEVKDLTSAEALTKAAEGCAGFAAVASDVSFGTDPEKVITPAVNLAKAALAAAYATPTIKRFVQTSSSAAASDAPPGTPKDLAVDNFNTSAIERAYNPTPGDPSQPMSVYQASKVLQEQAVWSFREEKRKSPGGLHFGVNTVLPDLVVGEILDVAHQGFPSSPRMLKAAWDGDMALAAGLPPQYEIDAHDTAMLHVAALLHPEAEGERIFGYAFPKNLTNTIALLRELYPERTFMDPPADEKENKENILGRPRSEELLKWVKGSGFTGFKESLKELTQHFS